MQFVLIVTAFITAVAAVFGKTTKTVDTKLQLTSIGWVVISMTTAAALASVLIEIKSINENHALEAVYKPQVKSTTDGIRMLLRYLDTNAKLEREHGPNSTPYDGTGVIPRGSIMTLDRNTPVPSFDEVVLADLLSEFNMNPPRYPHAAWPQPATWRPRRFQTIDQRLSNVASDILTELDSMIEQYGDVMSKDLRARFEELRMSPFLIHLSEIREVAVEARLREDSDSYPVHLLEPGVQGAPRKSLARLLELLREEE